MNIRVKVVFGCSIVTQLAFILLMFTDSPLALGAELGACFCTIVSAVLFKLEEV